MAGSISDILAGLQNGVTSINNLTTKFSSMADFGSSISGILDAISVTVSSISATQQGIATTLSSISNSLGSIAGLSQLKLNYGQFAARISSNSTGIPGALNKIRFNTELLDNDSIYRTSDFVYQPTRSGWYYIHIGVHSDGAAETPLATIFKDGSALWAGTYGSAAGAASVCAGIVELNGSSNYVEGYSYLPAAGTVFTATSATYGFLTYMFGWRVA